MVKVALPIDIELLGSKQVQKQLAQIKRRLSSGTRMKDAFESAGELVAMDARDLAPEWRRDLYASIDNETIKDTDGFVAVVFSDREYAPPHERGTDAYWPQWSVSFIDWCRDHGMNPMYVARLIASRGLNPLKFFEQALRDDEDKIVELIGQAVADIVERTY